MKVSDKTSVSMPIKNMIGIVVAVAMGVFAYTEVTARLTSLETSRELFQADLLKKSEQKPTDQDSNFSLLFLNVLVLLQLKTIDQNLKVIGIHLLKNIKINQTNKGVEFMGTKQYIKNAT